MERDQASKFINDLLKLMVSRNGSDLFITADRRQADIERKAAAARASERARRAWAQCAHDGDSAYLSRKGVQAHGVRFSGRGNLVIPMCDAGGSVHGLQVIYGTKKNGRDKDFWPAGLAKQGHFFLCGPSPSGGVLLIAEGYATAASLFEATGHPCAVAFDAGNLMPVATALAHHYPRAKILICADDDYLTEGNPGVTKASNAALAVNGAWIAPAFTARFGDVVDRLSFYAPYKNDPDTWLPVIEALQKA